MGIVLLNYRTFILKNDVSPAIQGSLVYLGKALYGAYPNTIDYLVIALHVASVLYLLPKGNRININYR